jgi:hypothetical protein
MPKSSTAKPQAWMEFEKKVAEIFRLYGFFPTANTIVAGRQVDILLASSEEFVGP